MKLIDNIDIRLKELEEKPEPKDLSGIMEEI
jgi:hypothetical protein